MENFWFLLSIVSCIFSGLNSFISKILSQKKYDTSAFFIYAFFSSTIYFFIYYLIKQNFSFSYLVFIMGFLSAIFWFCTIYFKIEGLKYIDSIIFFPIYKVFSNILVLIIGIIFFTEFLTIKQSIGFGLGLFVPMLLINKIEFNSQKKFKKGIILCFVVIIAAILTNFVSKSVTKLDLNIDLYIMLTSLFSLILSQFIFKKKNGQAKTNGNTKTLLIYGFLSGFCIFIISYTYVYALKYGDLSIIYMIQSFSILIPIILSIIFYKESINVKKILAIILTIVSLILFI